MRYIWVILCSFLVFSAPTFGIEDLSTSDGDYSAINRMVKKGYFSLYSNNAFKPERAISRREAALIINKLTREIDRKNISLSNTDLSELKALSTSFKSVYTDNENTIQMLQKENQSLLKQQRMLHHDISELTDTIGQLKKERKLVFGLLAGVGILALL